MITTLRIAQCSAVAVSAIAITVTTAACGDQNHSSKPPVSTVVVTKTNSAAPSRPPVSDAHNSYQRTRAHLTGTNGRAQFDVTIPQIAGGNSIVTSAFNRSMRTALNDQITGAYDRSAFTLETNTDLSPAFHIGEHVISGEMINYAQANPPGAHGDSLIATITINADNAEPITLEKAFSDLSGALSILSGEAGRQLRSQGVSSPVADGFAPQRDNFLNWTASPQGMAVHFGDYQVGAHAEGLRTIVVPWPKLSGVLAPGMQKVLSS